MVQDDGAGHGAHFPEVEVSFQDRGTKTETQGRDVAAYRTGTRENRAMPRIGSVVMGASDVRRAAAFWTAALGYVPREEPEDDWVVLVHPEGAGAQLSLGLSETPVQERPRVHLDLYAGDAADQAAEVERLVGLGARRVDWDPYPEDADFIVLADTEGNRFCVIDTGRG
jgi:catechol 2,3-dioxygenase-like lactoylglutathione lyase family enzyme